MRTNDRIQIPTYIKYFFIIGSIILTWHVIDHLSIFFDPLILSIIFAIGLSPLCSVFEKIMPRFFSSLASVLLVMFVLLLIFFCISVQIANINFDFNASFGKLGSYVDSIKQWGAAKLDIKPPKQTDYLTASLSNIGKSISSYVNYIIGLTKNILTSFVFFLLSLFFLLYYRQFLVTFLFKITAQKNHRRIKKIIEESVTIIKLYFIGLSLDIFIVAILNVLGLLAIGIPHAFFFGILAAFLLVIPYIGILIGASLPILFSLMTMNSIWYPVGVILIFSFIQFLEGNLISPNIIGDKVGLNPFSIIIGMLLGGLLFGIIGFVITIPILSIIKVIFHNIQSFESLSFIMGTPPNSKD
ncbi:MAG: AI-2E family transporter [Gammaproteobacteria bacterium]|nr:AI-2E family transporter [Gammaproteobacteria bacterium]